MNDEPSLAETLRHLQEQLTRIAKLDVASRERLRAVAAEIERCLRESEKENPLAPHVVTTTATAPFTDAPASKANRAEEDSLLQQLQGAAQHFEVTHPRLAATLEQAIELLQRMGI